MAVVTSAITTSSGYNGPPASVPESRCHSCRKPGPRFDHTRVDIARDVAERYKRTQRQRSGHRVNHIGWIGDEFGHERQPHRNRRIEIHHGRDLADEGIGVGQIGVSEQCLSISERGPAITGHYRIVVDMQGARSGAVLAGDLVHVRSTRGARTQLDELFHSLFRGQVFHRTQQPSPRRASSHLEALRLGDQAAAGGPITDAGVAAVAANTTAMRILQAMYVPDHPGSPS
jgi:hypothetical protein